MTLVSACWCLPRLGRALVVVLGVLWLLWGRSALAEPLLSSGDPKATLLGPPTPANQSSVETGPEVAKFAVVIGNNLSLGRRRPELHYADDDAARYFEILDTLAPGRVALLSRFDRDTERLFPKVAPKATPPTRATLQTLGRARAPGSRSQCLR